MKLTMACRGRLTAGCFARGFLLAVALGGCGGSSDDGPPPGTPARLSIVSGNGQTAEQHLRIPQDLVVSVTDRDGQRVDTAVEFTPAPGSPPFLTDWPLVKTRNPWGSGDGVHWFAFFHTPGAHRIVATVAGLPPVTFDVNVTPSTHPYDGPYLCQVGGFRDSVMTIVHGVQTPWTEDLMLQNQDALHFIYTAVVDEATGAMTAGFRRDLDYRLRLAGQLSADAIGQVTGSGTFDLLFHDVPPSVGTGTWSCSRF